VGVERRHAVFAFDWGRSGTAALARRIDLPREALRLSGNSGLEALAVAPPRSPLAGALIAIAERSRNGENAPSLGFILTGPRAGTFRVARADGFDLTDMAFLANGEALLLERRFSLLGGFSVRLRRIAREAIRPGALVDGPVLYESDASQVTDNMEGLCVHLEGNDTIVTMVSDDNFSMFQKTLLLEFVLAE
jgi:hypothetical protein